MTRAKKSPQRQQGHVRRKQIYPGHAWRILAYGLGLGHTRTGKRICIIHNESFLLVKRKMKWFPRISGDIGCKAESLEPQVLGSEP